MKKISHIKWNVRGYEPFKEMMKEVKTRVLFAVLKTTDTDYLAIKRKLDRWFSPIDDVFYDLFHNGTSIGKIRLVLRESTDRINSLDPKARVEILSSLREYKEEVEALAPTGVIFYNIFLNNLKEVA